MTVVTQSMLFSKVVPTYSSRKSAVNDVRKYLFVCHFTPNFRLRHPPHFVALKITQIGEKFKCFKSLLKVKVLILVLNAY